MRIGQDKDGPQTIIGKTVTVKGEILGTEQLVVEGTVEGRIMIETSVFIREGGLVKADVDANIINVAGGVVGNISVKDKIEIVSGGYVLGDIRAPRLIINDGASVKGTIDMDVKPPRGDSASPSKSGEDPGFASPS
ncbi:MAG: polymer-forming cytoskeletal protein [Verrucomicrobia bacterium]|nr:polymer-forming cytoskeletal protein [Pseudomonadota bacterium]NBS07020.1 polymer-forming cytoskeletal protein [Verrucomicrobiota bacterium]NBT24179.1 polymer-forming cytoskeletal protein [bacterium]NBS50296.1 polymer-forming cytoskeletal protein [Verrucomicrobiota bacterium]NBV97529.1 polymer-forming cytoskeletal protein [Verrucomicrobiota bacterium]